MTAPLESPVRYDREAFHEAIAALPNDPSQKLVYADWLDEQGQTREALGLRALALLNEGGRYGGNYPPENLPTVGRAVLAVMRHRTGRQLPQGALDDPAAHEGFWRGVWRIPYMGHRNVNPRMRTQWLGYDRAVRDEFGGERPSAFSTDGVISHARHIAAVALLKAGKTLD
jgi:uncharacterized protein (TIGR02996 family)